MAEPFVTEIVEGLAVTPTTFDPARDGEGDAPPRCPRVLFAQLLTEVKVGFLTELWLTDDVSPLLQDSGLFREQIVEGRWRRFAEAESVSKGERDACREVPSSQR